MVSSGLLEAVFGALLLAGAMHALIVQVGGDHPYRRPATWVGLGLVAVGMGIAVAGGLAIDRGSPAVLGVSAGAMAGLGLGLTVMGMLVPMWPGAAWFRGEPEEYASIRAELERLSSSAQPHSDPIRARLVELRGALGALDGPPFQRRRLLAEIDRRLQHQLTAP